MKTGNILPNDFEVDQWYEINIGNPHTPCSASSAIYKFRLWLKERAENQSVISEEEILHKIRSIIDERTIRRRDWGKGQTVGMPPTSREDNYYADGFEDGLRYALSLSSNDKQEKKPLYEISDEDAIEVTKLANFHPKHQNAESGKHIISEQGIVEYINAYEYLQIWQYLQFKGYKLPVYYPEKKGESND